MKLLSVSLEKLTIRTILSGNNEIANRLLGSLTPEHFHYPPAVEAFNRIKRQIRSDGQNPKWIELLNDPAIEQKHREIWANYKKRAVKSRAQGRVMLKKLEEFRITRQVYFRSRANIKALSEDKVDVGQLLQDNRTTFNSEQALLDTDEIFRHFGVMNNSDGLIERLRKGDNTPIIPTGIDAWDGPNVGILAGSLFMIGATTGGGKTAVAMQIGLNMALRGARVAHVNLEMSKDELECRLLANISKTQHDKFLDPKERMGPKDFKRIERAERRFNRRLKKLDALYSIVVPTVDPVLEDMFVMLTPYGYDVTIIDMINLCKGMSGEMQWQRLSEGARFAKRYASINNCIVIMLCQIGEAGEIRYSRALAEHASVFWTWKMTEEAKKDEIIKINILKARNQRTYSFKVRTDFARMRFKSEIVKEHSDKTSKNKVDDADYYDA